MRLFVAVLLPPEVLTVVERMDRPAHPDVRWATRAQLHITLRFLGAVEGDDVPSLIEALRGVAASQPARPVELGPATRRLGRRTLVVPVADLDDLGNAVVRATRTVGADPGTRPFRAHLTLARSRGDRPVPKVVAGQVVRARWVVDEITLVHSHLDPAGARYETIASAPLTNQRL